MAVRRTVHVLRWEGEPFLYYTLMWVVGAKPRRRGPPEPPPSVRHLRLPCRLRPFRNCPIQPSADAAPGACARSGSCSRCGESVSALAAQVPCLVREMPIAQDRSLLNAPHMNIAGLPDDALPAPIAKMNAHSLIRQRMPPPPFADEPSWEFPVGCQKRAHQNG